MKEPVGDQSFLLARRVNFILIAGNESLQLGAISNESNIKISINPFIIAN